MSAQDTKVHKSASLETPTDLTADAVRDISGALNILLADMFGLYLKTKNFHWHVSGPHFRCHHPLPDEQGDQLAASIDILAERARKIGGTTVRSIGQIAKLQRIKDNDKNYVPAVDMLLELMNDNKAQTRHMREAHEVADKHEDVATASLLENFIDEAEKRCWFLFEASRAVRPLEAPLGNTAGPLARPRGRLNGQMAEMRDRWRPALYGPPSSTPCRLFCDDPLPRPH